MRRAAEQLSASSAAHQEAVLHAGLPQVEARLRAEATISCGEARKRGAPSLRELRERGVTIVEAKNGGYTSREAAAARYSLEELRLAYTAKEIGDVLRDLKQEGTTCAEAKNAGYSLDEIKAAGYVEGFAEAGFTCKEVKAAGFGCYGAQKAGFTPLEGLGAGYRCCGAWRDDNPPAWHYHNGGGSGRWTKANYCIH